MKTKLLTLIAMLFTLTTFAQNDLKARVEFEEAETAFAAEDYATAVTHLTEAEKLLGKWTPKIGYLLIVSLDKTLDFDNPNKETLKTLRTQVTKYMKYAENNKEVLMEKFKEVYTIDENTKLQEQRFREKADPDHIKAEELYEAKDYEAANEYFEKVAKKGSAAALTYLAFIYADKKEYDKAIESYQQAAKKGNVYALYYLGAYYYNGIGVTKDYSTAMQFFKKAADLGCPAAMNQLGYMYSFGEGGVEKNESEGFNWYKKAVLKGNKNAIANLGASFFYGLGTQKDENKGLMLLKKASDNGDEWATRKIGDIYYNKQDYVTAIKWYEKGGENGDVKAMTALGNLYKSGKVNNPTEMIKWYTKAAEKDDIDAMYDLWALYRYGVAGAQKNRKLANEWRVKYDEAKKNENK